MLKIENLYTGYSEDNYVLNGISLAVGDNEAVAILGQNGSGKSTVAKAIVNDLPMTKELNTKRIQKNNNTIQRLFGVKKKDKVTPKKSKGKIIFNSVNIFNLPTQEIMELGIGIFYQGGRVFSSLTGIENLKIAYGKKVDEQFDRNINELAESLDILKKENIIKLTKIKAGVLSGGERHQLALAMVLLKSPKFLILDEVSAGLDPSAAKEIFSILIKLKEKEKNSFIIIEQNVKFALSFADRVLFLEEGQIIRDEKVSNLDTQEKINKFNLGK